MLTFDHLIKRKVVEDESEQPIAVVVARGWDCRDTRILRGHNASLLDGTLAQLVGPWSDALGSPNHVHDPPGIIFLRDARNILVGNSVERRTLPSLDYF